jgi:outer membrane protein TolC
LPNETKHNLKEELIFEKLNTSREENLRNSFLQRDEILIAKEKQLTAKSNFQMINHLDNPNLNFIGSAGFKNGYIPDLNVLKANYTLGLQFSYPLFDAQRTKNNLALAQSIITINDLDIEVVKRNISNEVVENETNYQNAGNKINQFQMQYQQAEKALMLAQISFKNGTITNLDLLDAETTFAESKLLLLKAQIDYTISYFKLKAALGDRLY